MNPVLTPELVITGAGIIGLTLALELHRRGASVAVLDTAAAAHGASFAAAGMLAAEDPHNPPELRELSALSISLYDGFLDRLTQLSGLEVPYQTTTTFEYLDGDEVTTLAERSVDPRQLAASAVQAVRRSGIPLLEFCGQPEITEEAGGVLVRTAQGHTLTAKHLIHASGAWFRGCPAMTPKKGQILRVRLPANQQLREVHRSSAIYIVPRTQGPQAGTALIGATVEDAGFDTTTSRADLDNLRARAGTLVPGLADPTHAPQVEAWAGLRPATRDHLPVIGQLPASTHQWIAGGHYRNGILLAPATAVLLADLIEGKSTAVDVSWFTPQRPI